MLLPDDLAALFGPAGAGANGWAGCLVLSVGVPVAVVLAAPAWAIVSLLWDLIRGER